MAEDRPIIPPPDLPVSQFLTPAPSVVFFSEQVSRESVAYQANAPMKRGTLYSSIQGAKQQIIDAYPTLYFVKESQIGRDDTWVTWTWVNVPEAEDSYNAEIDYLNHSTAAPRFLRVYNIRRDVYESSPTLALGAALTGLIGVNITEPGNGYTYATGTIDTGATIEFVVSGGQLISGVVTAEGENVVSGGSIVITGDGAGATAISRIQPVSAILIGQKKQEFPDDHPLRNEFVRVTRLYETIPGPFITTSRVDDDGKTITVRRRHNLQSAIDAISAREYIDSGIWYRVSSEPVNWNSTDERENPSYFIGWEVQESRPLPGNAMIDKEPDKDGALIVKTKTLKALSTISEQEAIVSGTPNVWRTIKSEVVSELVGHELITDRPIAST